MREPELERRQASLALGARSINQAGLVELDPGDTPCVERTEQRFADGEQGVEEVERGGVLRSAPSELGQEQERDRADDHRTRDAGEGCARERSFRAGRRDR